MKKLLLILGFIFIGLFFIQGTTDQTTIIKNSECTPENVYLAIKQLGIKHPDIVFAQILLESNNLSSKLVFSNNNLMGMRLPKKRETTALQSKCGYAFYADWYSCVVDYLLYQINITRNRELTRSQYLNLIGKCYSETSDYKSRVKRVINENKSFIKAQDSVFLASGYDIVNVGDLVIR
jgi:Mannosyl-glycoprotein endo-beta-N-acetylglucosaminidase